MIGIALCKLACCAPAAAAATSLPSISLSSFVFFLLIFQLEVSLTIYIMNNRTFLKRKGGLFKKAHELSVLCSVDVAVIIFGHNKKLYEFSSGDIKETLGRYHYVCTSPPSLSLYIYVLTYIF